MRNPLLKRLPRELRKDKAKYTVLALFLIFMIGLVAGYMVADGSMVKAYEDSFQKYKIENGHFILDDPAPAKVLDKVRGEHVVLQEQFYKDKVSKAGLTKGDDVRVYKPRQTMNLLAIMEGRMPAAHDEIVIDRLYAENNHVKVGATMDVGGRAYTVTGTAAFSDYSCLFRTTTDFMFDANDFTVAVVTEEAWKAMGKGGIKYCYAWRNNDQTLSDKAQKDKGEDIADLLDDQRKVEVKQVLARPDNQAITFSGDDMGGDMVMMQTLLYIVLVIIAFVFAISTRSTIEQESKVIGTLRASGYTRGELLRHFITLPMLMVAIASVIGNIIGYTFMKDYIVLAYYHSYGLPPYETIFNGPALVSTTIIPAVLILVVELVVIGRALRYTPLQFLRGELGSTGGRGAIRLPERWPFATRFRARIILQNKSAYITMFLGIFLASVLLFFGTMFSPLLDHFQGEVTKSKFANYQYILKEPAFISWKDGEKYAVDTVKNDNDEDITVYGIIHGSEYFTGDLAPKEVLVSSAYAEKYGVRPGDKLTMHEKFGSHKYRFTVGGVYDYPATLCVFMYIDEFNDTFDNDKGYFCGYFADRPIRKLKEEQISSVITEKEMSVVSKQLDDSMGVIFPLFAGFAVILYMLLIFLLSKIAIDRNAYAISMVKILGYKDKEISRLYSRATGIVVVLSVLVCMVLSTVVVKKIYFVMMRGYNGWLSYYVAPRGYLIMLGVGLGCYFLVSSILMRRIRRIPMGEALKGLE